MMMNLKVKHFPLLFLALMIAGSTLAQSDRDGARSVVKVKTSFKTTENGKPVIKIGNASGWCYLDARHIVTDLHVVAGMDNKDIRVSTDKGVKSCGAKVVNVLKEADLALLELDEDLGLTPLQIAEVDPNSKKEYSIWGFPQGIFAMAGDDIRFSRSLSASATLNDLIGGLGDDVTGGKNLKRLLEEQQYPSTKAQILRVSSTIQPGHSGAPIFSSDGNVVGIADGGLREGTARLNWAMPANVYVPRLLTSKDPMPQSRSLQVSLYSSTTTVDAEATEQEQDTKMEDDAKANTVVNGNQSISKTWTASYDEILETMTDKDKADVMQVVNAYKINMSDTWFDVYEDYQTGATISVPTGENFIVKDGFFYVVNSDETLAYMAMPYNGEDYASAKNGINIIWKELMGSGTWTESPDSPDELKENDAQESVTFEATRTSGDGKNTILYYNAVVEGSNLLVVAMLMDGTKMQNPDYIKQVVTYSVACNLATFAGN
jgi:S1-C subfamily serine protease